MQQFISRFPVLYEQVSAKPKATKFRCFHESTVSVVQNSVCTTIQAGSVDMRYPCSMVHRILSTDWGQYWSPSTPHDNAHDNALHLAPGLGALVISRLRNLNSARVSAMADTKAMKPTLLHAGPISLSVITKGLFFSIALLLVYVCMQKCLFTWDQKAWCGRLQHASIVTTVLS
jgi:hypothetical protein